MRTSYQTDRAFTEYVHRYVAIPTVYQELGWSPFRLTASEIEQLDRDRGIDRIFYTDEGYLVSIQERFRSGQYAAHYNDVTLRYRRDRNVHTERRWSEFFKIQADYLLYGIVDGNKGKVSTISHFRKVALLSVPALFNKFEQGLITIEEKHTGASYRKAERMVIPVNHNQDGSSSFIALDVTFLHQLWPGEILVWQQGFL